MVSSLEKNLFIFRLACLADILQHLNKVNLKPHGTLSAFVEKLDNWN